MYSNGYIFRYAAILVILVAAVLSTTALVLKPYQEKNDAVDKMQSILSAGGFENVNAKNAIELFNKNITNMMLIDQEGNIVDDFTSDGKENSKAFKVNLKEELYKKSINQPFNLAMYVVNNNGEKIFIIPLRGVGLWGPIWGNIALKDDFKTVVGVTFGHKSETPGLGAEIETPAFEGQFPGKTIFDESGNFVSVGVIKGGLMNQPVQLQNHLVDAISGGTITSNGVGAMLKNVLESYEPFIKKQG